jgi:IS5 family transposase
MKPRQGTLSEAGFVRYQKVTRREAFLTLMDEVVPWTRLEALIRPIYPTGEGPGRPPIGLDRMLRMYFLQLWFELSDPAAEEALYDSQSMRRFVGIDLGREAAPDETTICKFRHLLTQAAIGKQMLLEVNAYLAEHGYRIRNGTIVDATLIDAPSSTKNKAKARDPEMHQTKKGNQWYFGMKGHIGVDSKHKIIHHAEVTAANMADCNMLPELLHGQETRVWGDTAYQGKTDEIRQKAPRAQDFTHRRARHNGEVDPVVYAKNHTKSRVRARVEHPFLVIKRIFGFRKVRYRGLQKNGQVFVTLCALANLYRFRYRL